jgi:hypothetical protein
MYNGVRLILLLLQGINTSLIRCIFFRGTYEQYGTVASSTCGRSKVSFSHLSDKELAYAAPQLSCKLDVSFGFAARISA